MFIDARTLPKNQVIETDVCIVGAGAAGITLAREFIGQTFRVSLLESGGLEFAEETQSLYKGENIGLPYFPLDDCRLRFFGGTTNHWEGLCRPLDEIDFETRDWIPYSGWPFDKTHLDPFYQRAQSICQLGPFAYDVEFWENPKTAPRLPFVGNRVMTQIFQFSPPTRFGEVYRNEIMGAGNVSTYLHANVVDIETNEAAQTVTRLRVATLGGNRFWVTAKLFILAAGGIENPRLLLSSNTVQSAGLGNHHDLVGRFFMEHPKLDSGVFLPSDPHLSLPLYLSHTVQRTSLMGFLTLAEEVLRSEQMVQVRAQLIPQEAVSKGVESFKLLRRMVRIRKMPDKFWIHLRNVIADIDNVAIKAYRKVFPGTSLPVGFLQLRNFIESTPNPTSRVTLSDERDDLGKKRVQLHWRLNPIDKRSLRRAHEIFGQELGRAGLGRLRVDLDDDDTRWPASLRGVRHHMGTTRMHRNPKHGVVDEHCRVHEMANLFIAGSSVFPTVGHANPTLTIVALAVRLADHVKKLMT